MKLPTILVVDDDRNFLRVLSYQIEEFGFRSLPASSAAGAYFSAYPTAFLA